MKTASTDHCVDARIAARMGLAIAWAWLMPFGPIELAAAKGEPAPGTGQPAPEAEKAMTAPAEPPALPDTPASPPDEPAADSSRSKSVTEAPGPKSGKTAYGVSMKPRLSGRLRVTYDYQTQGEYKDSDLYGYFYGNARDLNNGRLDIYTSLRLHSDLDSATTSSLASDPYWSLDNSDGVTENRLLQLYFDVHDRKKRVAFRGGRQYVDIADYLHIDGGQLMLFEEEKLGGRAYLGRPVSYYSDISGDLAGGLSLIGRPWEGNQTRLTFARYYEDIRDDSDQNYFLDIRQQLSEQLRARGQCSLLNDEFRMARLDAFYFSADGMMDLSLGGSYWGEFDAKTRAYSPLYNVLGQQQAYTYVYARLTRRLAAPFIVSPGMSLRFLNDGPADFSNRDYQNYDLTFIYEPVRSFSSSVSFQYWDVRNDDSFFGVTGQLRYRYRRIWEASGGASYAEYTYETFSDLSTLVDNEQTFFFKESTVIEESPDVYTYFVRAKWNITRKLSLRLQFDVEDNETASDLAYRGRVSVEVRY